MTTKWVLRYGIIRNDNSFTSRDVGSLEKDTKEECLKALEEQRRFLGTIGYKIWFAYDPVEVTANE